jgi:adsorption protein B
VPIDRALLAIVAPLALAILISGLDDLFIDAAWLASWIRTKLRPAPPLWPPGPRQLETAPRRAIAIMIPLWQEHEVIARMLAHNVAAIRYTDYHIFAGAYPNDDRTQDAVREISDRHSHVHLSLCPHDGPTSKADCLNWIYQHIALYEEQKQIRFEVVLIHDAEDVIHPDELHWVNYYAARFDFIQTPVLALRTPLAEIVHGIYCDEFAEYHTRDMPVRPLLGGFVPSAGVGTAYRREALERIASERSNRVFEPDALTEDYENGLHLARLGCSQAFVPLVQTANGFVATREYFPQNWRAALRQRTRWVTGIALQGWERFGWGRSAAECYWLWRDRKGLVASPLGLAANLLFVYGVFTKMWTRGTPLESHLVAMTAAVAAIRIIVRAGCAARIYSVRFAMLVPVRAVAANVLNASATVRALWRYAAARIRKRPLVWLKTEHAFPSRAFLLQYRRKLGEILSGSGYVSEASVQEALASKPEHLRIGEYLVKQRLITEEELYEALSLQHGLPLAMADRVPIRIARALPESAVREWQVLPFRLSEGQMCLATPELPAPQLSAKLRQSTNLEIRFHLVTRSRFETLTRELL